MRALTVRQPWAWAIIHGQKSVENRSRNIAGSYRGPVAIHAAKADATLTQDDLDTFWRHADGWPPMTLSPEPGEQRGAWPHGALIGVVDLVGVHHAGECWKSVVNRAGVAVDEWDCSPWAQDGAHHLVLANPLPLAEPIPYRGRLGLWTLPDDVLGVA